MDEITIEVMALENKEALIDKIMTRHGQDVLQLVYSYVKNRSIAEDLTQEIFIKCYRSLDTYKGKAKLKTWIWRIAINHCKDYIKSWYNQNVTTSLDETILNTESKESIEQTVIQINEDQQLATAVMNLSIKYREVIYLYYFEELSLKEIAMLIEVNENTVKTRLKRAKELLKEVLEEQENG